MEFYEYIDQYDRVGSLETESYIHGKQAFPNMMEEASESSWGKQQTNLNSTKLFIHVRICQMSTSQHKYK